MSYVIDKSLKPSPVDTRDKISTLNYAGEFPTFIDLKPFVYEIENQLQFSSCTANSSCSALELMYKQNKKSFDLSRFFLYYYTRYLGNIRTDGGSYPRDIGRALKNYGVCLESTWEYTPAHLTAEPSDVAKEEAKHFVINSYEAIVGNKLDGIKNALMKGIPVILSIEVHQGFFNLFGPWKTHSWDFITSNTNPSKGWHSVLVIGYDDVSKRLLVENSWGSYWGDGGFFGIPYDMINTNAFGELWILNPNLNVDIDQPVINPSFITRLINKLNVLIRRISSRFK